MTVRNLVIANPVNYGVAMTPWQDVRELNIDGLRVTGPANGAFSGGAILGTIKNVTGWAGTSILRGQNFHAENINVWAFHALEETKTLDGTDIDVGGLTWDNVRVIDPDSLTQYVVTAPDCEAGKVYALSGPSTSPTVTALT